MLAEELRVRNCLFAEIPVVVGLCALLFILCGSDSYTGVSEVGNPSDKVSLSGHIHRCNGAPADNVALVLLPSTFNPATDSQVISHFTDTTGDRGEFKISGIPRGTYALNGRHIENGTVSFFPNIDLRLEGDNSVCDTVWKAGMVSVFLPSGRVDSSNAVYVRGTEKYAFAATREIELDGMLEKHLEYLFYHDVVGEYDLEIADDSTIPAFFISADSVVQFEYRPYAPSGPTEVSVDSLVLYQASFDPFPPYKDCMGVEMIRMTWGNGDTTEWKVGADFTHSWDAPGTYAVQSQTRCETMFVKQEVRCLSRWSDSLRVVVVD